MLPWLRSSRHSKTRAWALGSSPWAWPDSPISPSSSFCPSSLSPTAAALLFRMNASILLLLGEVSPLQERDEIASSMLSEPDSSGQPPVCPVAPAHALPPPHELAHLHTPSSVRYLYTPSLTLDAASSPLQNPSWGCLKHPCGAGFCVLDQSQG